MHDMHNYLIKISFNWAFLSIVHFTIWDGDVPRSLPIVTIFPSLFVLRKYLLLKVFSRIEIMLICKLFGNIEY